MQNGNGAALTRQALTDLAKRANFTPIYCSGCGRFMGYARGEPEVYLRCKDCKEWTILVGEGDLTDNPLLSILSSVGRKVS